MRSMVRGKRPAAAGGRRRQGAFSAAVEKREQTREREAFFGHRKAAHSDEAASSNLATPTIKEPSFVCRGKRGFLLHCTHISGNLQLWEPEQN